MGTSFYIVYGIWFLSEMLISRLLRSGADDQKGLDKRSLRVIWITVVLACTSGVFIPSYLYLPIFSDPSMRYLGLALILSGILLRILVIRSLGKAFTADVTIRKNHMLKTDGPYRIVRHPSYAASLLSFVGFGFSLNNWLSLVLITVLIVMAFLYRIKIEEDALLQAFGDQYIQYKKRTSKLIPFLV
ncbi:MAG: isoprenylcysteine carboxylmethyltransferase family protein [Chitinophagaceae bacterium]